MCSHHERFLNAHAGAIANVDERPCFVRIQRNWFFTKNVLAGFSGFHGPGNMQVIRERVINCFDGVVRQQLFITSVRVRNVQLRRQLLLLLRDRVRRSQ